MTTPTCERCGGFAEKPEKKGLAFRMATVLVDAVICTTCSDLFEQSGNEFYCEGWESRPDIRELTNEHYRGLGLQEPFA